MQKFQELERHRTQLKAQLGRAQDEVTQAKEGLKVAEARLAQQKNNQTRRSAVATMEKRVAKAKAAARKLDRAQKAAWDEQEAFKAKTYCFGTGYPSRVLRIGRCEYLTVLLQDHAPPKDDVREFVVVTCRSHRSHLHLTPSSCSLPLSLFLS